MGKKSSYPDYSTGTITVNGTTKASSTRDKSTNTVDTSYNMSEMEQNIYDSIQSGMYTSLQNLFSVSDAQREEWSNQLTALKNQGIEEIESIYTPMETELKNDIASRFGNFDNSVFLDSLNEITDKKAKAVSELSDSLLSTQNQLYTDELTNRINLITLLSNLNSVMNNNILNYTTAAGTNANSGNSYNNSAYNASSSGSSLFSSINSGANTALSYLQTFSFL